MGDTPVPNVPSTANRAAIGHPSRFDSGEIQFSQGSRVQGPLSHTHHGSRFATLIAHTLHRDALSLPQCPRPDQAAGWLGNGHTASRVQTAPKFGTRRHRAGWRSTRTPTETKLSKACWRSESQHRHSDGREAHQFPTVFCGRGSARQGPRRERTQCQRADETKGRDT